MVQAASWRGNEHRWVSPSSPSGREPRGVRRESGEHHDDSKDAESVRCAGHRGYCTVLDYNPHTVHLIPGAHVFCICKFESLSVLRLFLSFPNPRSLFQAPIGLICIVTFPCPLPDKRLGFQSLSCPEKGERGWPRGEPKTPLHPHPPSGSVWSSDFGKIISLLFFLIHGFE